MKSVCILCENAKLNEANALSLSITKSEILKTPLSEKGKAPATHWFCYLQTPDEGFEQLLGLQSCCIVEESSPLEFLKKHNLEKIKDESSTSSKKEDKN